VDAAQVKQFIEQCGEPELAARVQELLDCCPATVELVFDAGTEKIRRVYVHVPLKAASPEGLVGELHRLGSGGVEVTVRLDESARRLAKLELRRPFRFPERRGR